MFSLGCYDSELEVSHKAQHLLMHLSCSQLRVQFNVDVVSHALVLMFSVEILYVGALEEDRP